MTRLVRNKTSCKASGEMNRKLFWKNNLKNGLPNKLRCVWWPALFKTKRAAKRVAKWMRNCSEKIKQKSGWPAEAVCVGYSPLQQRSLLKQVITLVFFLLFENWMTHDHHFDLEMVRFVLSKRFKMFPYIIIGEFDPGSERTLAAWIRHASRAGSWSFNSSEKKAWVRAANGWVMYG